MEKGRTCPESTTKKGELNGVRSWVLTISEGFPEHIESDPKFGIFMEEEGLLSCQISQIKIHLVKF